MNQESLKKSLIFSVLFILPLMLIFSEAKLAHAQSVSHNNGESEIRLFPTFNFDPPSDEKPESDGPGGGR